MKKNVAGRALAVLLSALLVLSLAPFASAAGLLGGWELPEDPALGEETLAAFENASEGLLGVSYEPLALVGTQTVAGTNYCILCRARVVVPDAAPYFTLVYVYADRSGGAKILNIVPLENTGAAGTLPGGWIANDGEIDPQADEDVAAAFSGALEGLVGAEYEAVAYLSRQVVSGTNYCLLAKVTPVVPDARPALAQVYVTVDPQGKASLGDVIELTLSADQEPEESGKYPVMSTWTDEADGSLAWEEYYNEFGDCVKAIHYESQDPGYWAVQTSQYDEDGRLILTEIAYMDGTVWYTVRNEYDENGNLTVSSYTYYDDPAQEGELTETFENELDEKGRLARQTEVFHDSELSALKVVTVFTYDDQDRLITEESSYVPASPEESPADAAISDLLAEMATRTEYVYDEAGNRTESHTYNVATGEETEFTLWEYDDRGLVIRMTDGAGDEDTMSYTVEYSWDYPLGLDAYVGSFDTPSDAPSPASLEIREDGSFTVSIYRLTTIEGEAALTEEGSVLLRGTDASGGPIELTLRQEENGFSLTVTDSTWDLLPNGTVFPMAR